MPGPDDTAGAEGDDDAPSAGQPTGRPPIRKTRRPAPPRQPPAPEPAAAEEEASPAEPVAPDDDLGEEDEDVDPRPLTTARRHAHARQREPGRFRLRWVLVPLLLLFLAWVAVCAVTVIDSVGKLRSGVNAMDQVRSSLHTATLADSSASGPLHAATVDFGSAHHLLSDPWMAPMAIVPYLGRQVHSARSLAGAAHTVTVAGSGALTQTQALLRQPHSTPAQRARLVSEMTAVVDPLTTTIDHVDLGPHQALLPTLAAKRNTFASDLDRLRSDLDQGRAALHAVNDVLTGPRTYLVFAANNAEMRAGAGDYLEAGTMTSSQGTLTFGSFTPTDQLTNPASTIPVTGDLGALWGFQTPQTDYRQLGLSPQFPFSAALAVQMWQAQTGQKVDGVLVIDVDGLRSILSALGAVSADGQTIDAGSVDNYLLEQQYVGVTGDAAQNTTRHDQLGDLAQAVFGELQSSGASVTSLADALGKAAEGRHLMIWSSDPTIETDWQGSGAGGQVGPDGALLSLINNNANKLDPYQHLTAHLTTAPQGADTKITVTATFTNGTPAGLSPYAAQGTDPSLPSGSYVGTATLDFPGSAGLAHVNRAAVIVSGHDGASDVIGVPVSLTPGQSTSVTWTFVVSGHHGHLVVQPSARIPAVAWTGPDGKPFTDAGAHTVTW